MIYMRVNALKVKAVTSNDPTFLKTAYKYDHLIELVNNEIYIRRNECYITYQGQWFVYRMGLDFKPRRQGQYNNVFSAIYKARLG